MSAFQPFPKLPRLSRGCVITEKLDGTNAQIFICGDDQDGVDYGRVVAEVGGLSLFAGSRNRLITPDDDNYGFAGWVAKNAADLIALGEGRHFGEWWGSGIQRRYGLTGDDKRFSLFNTARWSDDATRPDCCGVVPVIYAGAFTDTAVSTALELLARRGSFAAPGFMDAEGVVVFHSASRTLFKKTLKDDHEPKSLSEARAA